MMQTLPPHFERKWKRPNDVAPFPNIWGRFEIKSGSGQSYQMKIQDLTPDRHEEVMKAYEEYFFGKEELFSSVKAIEDEETMISQQWNFYQCVKENLSVIVVLDEEDSKPTIVGGLLLVVQSRDDPPFPQLPGKARAKVHTFFGKLLNGMNAFETLKIDRYFKDFGLVVKPEYQRLGIGTKLFETMEIMAKTFDIPAAIIIFNNITSQAMASKLGYTVMNEVKLEDYVDENGKMILPTVYTKVVQLTYRRFQ